MKKKSFKRKSERAARTLLIIFFAAVSVFAAFKIIVHPPEPSPAPVITPTEVHSDNDDTHSGSETQTAQPGVPERIPYCYTILVSGLDNDNGGSDTNILVRFDDTNKKIDLVSLPRDTLMHNDFSSNKLNFAYAKGGTPLLRSEIENLLGVPVDFFVTVDLKGFVALVDQIGGVDFDVPIDMDYDDPYQDLSIHFKKGMQHLNGDQAMKVVRFRHNNDGTGYGTEDIGRIGTQQAFLKAVAKKLLNLSNIPAMAQIFTTYVKTDLTVGNLAWLGTQALGMGMEAVSFHTLPGDGAGYYRKQSVYVLDPEATLTLVNEALNPYNQPITAEDMDVLVP